LRRWSSRSDEVFGDAGLTHLDAELQQLAVNTRSAPEWVGWRDRADQRANVAWY
jgi:hypothetical protein